MGNITIGDKSFRRFALQLLDDDNGINEDAFLYLQGMLVETGNEDIIKEVDITDGKAYIGEDFAEEELEKLGAPRDGLSND